MNDLIRRKDALEILSERAKSLQGVYGDLGGACRGAMKIIKSLPSVEPKHVAKVLKHKYWFGVSLNVVGESTIGYEWLCENCKKKVLEGDDYCSHCGSKLDWGETKNE